MELEFFLLNDKGKMSFSAPKIIEELSKDKTIEITREIGKNMVEFGCFPGVETFNPAFHMVESLQKTVDHLKAKDLMLYPFATYPGSFKVKMNHGKKYDLQKKIYGTDKMDITCRVTGFHHHYTLPKSVFDAEKKMLRILRKGKLGRSLISSYNLEIAADPVLTLFAQSSPFYQGKYLAKDSRLIVYRGGKKLGFMEGLYADHQQFGGLPPYKQTATDLLTSLEKRWQRFEMEMKKADHQADIDKYYPYRLDIAWNPVKINKHGTLEQRGMDVNFPSIVVGITVLLKFCLMNVQRHFLEVLPADHGIDEAFKVEGNVLYVPPHTVVRDTLQSLSAYKGYNSDLMRYYAKRFFHFAQSCTPKKYYPLISPIKEMIEEKQSMSDKILAYAKWKGYLEEESNGSKDTIDTISKSTISDKNAAELALHYAEHLPKNIEETKKKLQKLKGV